MFVIELNPFGRPDGLGTGTPLFDLHNEFDRAILFGENQQSDSWVWRVRTSEPDQPLSQLVREGPLRDWLIEKGAL